MSVFARIESCVIAAAGFQNKAGIATLLSSTAVALVMASAPAAFAADAAPAVAQAPTEEIVVTGSRIVREGFDAPTPLTVISTEALQNFSSPNIADAIGSMPAFAGSLSTANTSSGLTSGTAGVSQLNLRSLGISRTLILIDGARSVGSTFDGAVDINTFPQSLVSRVDVVTGGASAVYGSDAVAGVVNFVLDKEFVGTKGELSGGLTSYGDDASYKVSLTEGLVFGGGRGHFIISGEIVNKDGIPEGSDRPYTASTMVVVNNPAFTATNGLPRQVIWTQAGISNGTPGGIITGGPLKGIAFGPGGTPYTFQYGSLVSGNFMQGGAWQTTYPGPYAGDFIDLPESRQMVFARASYDVTDNFNLFVQGQFARSATFDRTLPYAYLGNLTIKSDNAFIPASVRAQVTAAGITSFAFGSTNKDIPSVGSDNEHALNRYVIGGNGKFDLFGNPWSYNFYYQYGKVRNSIDSFNTLISARYAAAIDAVVNPANGQIVCRSTLTAPTNGCVPYNVFGIGVNNQQVLNYILAHAHLNYDNVQQAEEAVVTGPITEGWAGPISAAFSVAHRSEKTYGVGDPISAGLGFFTSNFIPTKGSYNVTEGSAELDVPLAKDTSWAKAFDLSLAARFTDYTTSGYVTTWKVGGIWTPIDDIKFRATRSRDIRAPTLAQFFATSSGGGSAALLDPFTNTQPSIQALNSGNINLKPERADETELGVVLQPFFWPGFSFSVDYWHIKINDAIASAGGQNAINLCYTKGQFCDQLKRNAAGVLTQVYNLPLNLAAEDAKGLDFELGYRIPLADINADWGGSINLHSNTTIYLHDITSSPILPTRDIDGVSASNGAPNWSSTSTLGYTNDAFSASVSARMISSGIINNTYVLCTTACPASTVTDPTVDFNHVPAVVYVDTSLSYKLALMDDVSTEIFFNVRNLLDKDPPPTPSSALQQTGGTWGFQAYKYDVIGRAYRLGVRFKM